MSEPRCAFTKPDGRPCAARPRPNRPFCLFHDPEQQGRLADARRKGGAAPRRRIRRYPRILDHYDISELLGELFMEAVNDPAAVDCRRLHAITNLARTLLKAVGVPDDYYLEYDRPVEFAPTTDYLLRVYPPLSPDAEALLEAELPAAPDPVSPTNESAAAPPPEDISSLAACPPSADPSDPSDPSDQSDSPTVPADSEQAAEQTDNKPGTGHLDTPADESAPLNTQTPEPLTPEQGLEQDPNRSGTGPSPTTGPFQPASDPPHPEQTPAMANTLNPPPPPAAPADGPPPEPEPRHILVDPHAPWPGPARTTPGYVIVDLPFGPTGRSLR